MHRWKCSVDEFPKVILHFFFVWPRELLVWLTKVQSGHQENENSNDERKQQSEDLLPDKYEIVFPLSIKESGANSRNVEKHGDTNLDQTFDNTVFLVLNLRYVLGLKATSIK